MHVNHTVYIHTVENCNLGQNSYFGQLSIYLIEANFKSSLRSNLMAKGKLVFFRWTLQGNTSLRQNKIKHIYL